APCISLSSSAQARGPVSAVSATGRAMAATGRPPAQARHRARLWPWCVPRYNYYKQPSRVRDPNASARAPAPAHLVKTRARPAAAVSAGDAARGGRRLRPCDPRGGRAGGRHARLCGSLRPRGIRGRAGARGAARDCTACPLRWPQRARRRARGARSARAAHHLRLAGRGARQWRARRRGAAVAGAAPPRADENEPPAWLVFAAMIRTVAMGDEEPGLRPLSAALEEEGFDDLGSGRLVESFARHLMVALDAWQEQGFGEIAKNYLARL